MDGVAYYLSGCYVKNVHESKTEKKTITVPCQSISKWKSHTFMKKNLVIFFYIRKKSIIFAPNQNNNQLQKKKYEFDGKINYS